MLNIASYNNEYKLYSHYWNSLKHPAHKWYYVKPIYEKNSAVFNDNIKLNN